MSAALHRNLLYLKFSFTGLLSDIVEPTFSAILLLQHPSKVVLNILGKDLTKYSQR